jgi:hypothetical protein
MLFLEKRLSGGFQANFKNFHLTQKEEHEGRRENRRRIFWAVKSLTGGNIRHSGGNRVGAIRESPLRYSED